MHVYQYTDTIDLSNAVVTIGMFDGVHLAHIKIIKTLIASAKSIHGKSVVITFWPHPRTVLKPEIEAPRLLTTQEEKIGLFDALHIDALVIIPFTLELSQWSADKFINDILINKLNTKKLIIGHDHHFGNEREGNLDYLNANKSRFGFEVEEIPSQFMDEAVISSTEIRKALSLGDCIFANKLLGRHYSITGRVVQGNQRGRTIGFPTANIHLDDDAKLIPENGVYAVFVKIDNKVEALPGMINIGYRPTFNGRSLSVEVHILDFDLDIYGSRLTISFVEKLRDEKKFDGVEKLIEQLKADRIKTKEILQTAEANEIQSL